jgi:hypothetical protein
MALIEEFHVVATHYPMDPNRNGAAIREGMIAKLLSTGFAELHDGVAGRRVMGLFGDSTALSLSDSNKATAFSDEIVINANGSTLFTQNRVSDPTGDETVASGRITVYNGGGQFHTDQYATLDGTDGASGSPLDFAPGDALYTTTNGTITTNTTQGQVFAVCVVAPRAYPSGVPGTDTTDGSLSLGTFITVKLEV